MVKVCANPGSPSNNTFQPVNNPASGPSIADDSAVHFLFEPCHSGGLELNQRFQFFNLAIHESQSSRVSP